MVYSGEVFGIDIRGLVLIVVVKGVSSFERMRKCVVVRMVVRGWVGLVVVENIVVLMVVMVVLLFFVVVYCSGVVERVCV